MQTVEQKIQLIIGSLIVQVASLQTQLEQAQEENKALRAQIDEIQTASTRGMEPVAGGDAHASHSGTRSRNGGDR